MGKTVLVVDLDPQANATSGLGLPRQEGTSLYHALLGQGTIEGQALPTAVKGLDIVPSELDLAGSEIEVARMESYLHCVQKALAPLVAAGRYDYIFLDCPPSLGILTMNALTAAHSVIVPIQCEYYALEGLSVIIQLIQKLRDTQANPAIDIEGIVMTMFDTRTRLAFQVVEEVRKHFGAKVYKTVIPRTVRLSEAPSHGQPIILYDAKCGGSQAYRHLTKEFLKRATATVAHH
jgi:chromosome partitioning protein